MEAIVSLVCSPVYSTQYKYYILYRKEKEKKKKRKEENNHGADNLFFPDAHS